MSTSLPCAGGDSKVRTSLLATNPTYRTWFLGDTIAQAGRAVSGFAFPLILLSLGNGSVLVGAFQSAIIVASVLSILPMGYLVDRFKRGFIMLICALVAVGVYVSLTILILFDRVSTVSLMVGAVIAVIASQGANITVDAMLRSIVSGKDFVSASALEEGRGSIIGLTAAPIGGFLFATNIALPFAANALGNLGLAVAAVKLRKVAVRRPTESAGRRLRQKTSRRGPLEGFDIMRRIPGITTLVVSNGFLNLMFTGCLSSIIYTWGRDGLSPLLIGLLSSSMLGASLLGSVFVAPVLARYRGRWIVLVASSVCVVAVVAASLTATYEGVLVAFSAANFVLPSANAVLGGYLSAAVPEEAQGRVGAAAELVATVVAPVGPLLAGVLVNERSLPLPLLCFAALGSIGIFLQLRSGTMTAVGFAADWDRSAVTAQSG